MPSFLPRPKLALFVAALVVPAVVSGACGSRTACIAYTQAEYNANNGCLAPSDAIAAFTSPSCPGSIVSVDGPGTFDGEICCYPVTYDSVVQSCNEGNGNSGPGFAGGVTTFGPPPPTTSCAPLCVLAFEQGGPPCGNPGAIQAYVALQACAGCNGAPTPSSCEDQCPSFCSDGALDPTCGPCLMTSCSAAVGTCNVN
jgi:hypothetical protein